VRHELEAYGEGLEDKSEILALNKIDALDEETRAAKAAELEAAAGQPVRMVSGAAKMGVTELLREAYALVRRRKAEVAAEDAPDQGWQP
jgi:GTP-binding protein